MDYAQGYRDGYGQAMADMRGIGPNMRPAVEVPPFAEPQPRKRKRKTTAYQAAYSKAFKKVAPTYKKKDGSWRKGGFAAAGRAARRDPAVRRAKKK